MARPIRGQIYLIHIVNADGTIWHYIGFTRKDDVMERVKDHKRLRGTRRICLAYRAGAVLSVHVLDQRASLTDERNLQYMSEATIAAHVCPQCRQSS
jgi:predicted GIY-YIG superfamily endonuclease